MTSRKKVVLYSVRKKECLFSIIFDWLFKHKQKKSFLIEKK